MAKAHVYVRVQVTEGSNELVRAVADAVAALNRAIDAAGGDGRGAVNIELDDAAPMKSASAPLKIPAIAANPVSSR